MNSENEISNNEKLFNIIVENYKKINLNLNNMIEDLESLKMVHGEYISNSSKKQKFHDYGVYVDDIYFQIKILKEEYNCMNNIYNMSMEKCYRDLYKLYLKIINRLIEVFTENIEVIKKLESSKGKQPETAALLDKFMEKMEMSKISNLKTSPNAIEELTSEQRQKYMKKIKTYKEFSNNTSYTYEDMKVLFGELMKRLLELKESSVLITSHVNDMMKSGSKGLLIQTYIISLTGEKDKIDVDWEVYKKILDSIIATQLKISKKFVIKTEKIADEYTDSENTDENKSDIISEDLEIENPLRTNPYHIPFKISKDSDINMVPSDKDSK